LQAAEDLQWAYFGESKELTPEELTLTRLAETAKDLTAKNGRRPTIREITDELRLGDWVLTVRGNSSDALTAARKLNLDIEIVCEVPQEGCCTLCYAEQGQYEHVTAGMLYAWWGSSCGNSTPGSLAGFERVTDAIKRMPEMTELIDWWRNRKAATATIQQ